MEMATRARTAETPKPTSHLLRPYAPHFYPDIRTHGSVRGVEVGGTVRSCGTLGRERQEQQRTQTLPNQHGHSTSTRPMCNALVIPAKAGRVPNPGRSELSWTPARSAIAQGGLCAGVTVIPAKAGIGRSQPASAREPDQPGISGPGADRCPVTATKGCVKGPMAQLAVALDMDCGYAWKLGKVGNGGFLLTEGGFDFRISRVKPNIYDGLLFVTGPHVCKGREDGFFESFPPVLQTRGSHVAWARDPKRDRSRLGTRLAHGFKITGRMPVPRSMGASVHEDTGKMPVLIGERGWEAS